MLGPLTPARIARRVQGDVERTALRARNGIKYVAGLDAPEVGLTPSTTAWERDRARLLRYDAAPVRFGPPLLIVHSLLARAYVWDLLPDQSFVRMLSEAGHEVYLLDWGEATALDAGNSLETYVDDYIPEAVAAVRGRARSRNPIVMGYCFGGVLTTLFAAAHPRTLSGLINVATPIDFHRLGPLTAMVRENRLEPETMIDETGNVPGEVMRNALRLLRPTEDAVQYANLWQHLWNDRFMESYQAIGGWVRDDVPFPGATFRQAVDLFARENALLAGEVPIGGRAVRLRDISCPFLNVLAEKDHIVPVASAEPATALVGSKDASELRLNAGHVALLLGRHASTITIPAISEWLARHGGSSRTRRPAGTPTAAKPTSGKSR